MESELVKILWDFMIQCSHYIEHRKPDIVVFLMSEKICLIIDVVVRDDMRIMSKESGEN